MKIVNIHAAKTQLSALVEEAAAGEEIIIAKAGKPVARLVPLEQSNMARIYGDLKGKIRMLENFDDPLPPEIAGPFGIKP
jgi:prevent-host-death family protein